MKKFAGMMPLRFVFADEGKNGLCGPAPSASDVVGAVVGFSIRYAVRHLASRLSRSIAAAPAATRTIAIAERTAQVIDRLATCDADRQP